MLLVTTMKVAANRSWQKKIAKYENTTPKTKKKMREIETYLEKKGTTSMNSKPTVQQHYASTFNSVDRFNRLLSCLKYLPREKDTDFCLFQSILRVAVIETWALVSDYKYTTNSKPSEQTLKQFAKQLQTQINELVTNIN